MSGARRWGSAMAMSWLVGCSPGLELEEATCPPGGTDLDYAGFAAPFFARHCNACHGARVNDRRGAPVAYVFDTQAEIQALDRRVFARSAADNTSMPPGPDDPSAEERDDLAEWLACGAP